MRTIYQAGTQAATQAALGLPVFDPPGTAVAATQSSFCRRGGFQFLDARIEGSKYLFIRQSGYII